MRARFAKKTIGNEGVQNVCGLKNWFCGSGDCFLPDALNRDPREPGLTRYDAY